MARSSTSTPTHRTHPALLALLAAAVLYFAREVLIPLALAILFTFLLAPLVSRLERLRLGRLPAVLVVVALAAGLLVGLGLLVQGQVLDFAANLPMYRENIREKLTALRDPGKALFGSTGDTIAQISKELNEAAPEETEGGAPVVSDEPLQVSVVDSPTPPLTYARSLLGPILSNVATLGIVIAFTIFMLIKREDLRNRFLRLVGEKEMHAAIPALDDAAERVSRYLLRLACANAGAGLLIGTGLFLLGVPGAALWGLLCALFRFIPYIGTWLAALLPFAVAIAVFPGWTQPLLVLGMILAIELAAANIVEPLLFGRGTGISPLAVLVSTVFWAWLWGPVGLLLALPLTLCMAVLGRHVAPFAFLDILLGDEPVLAPDAHLYQRAIAGDAEEAARLVEAATREKPLAEVYDSMVLPALRRAELDAHRGVLEPERQATVREVLHAVVEDADPDAPAGPRPQRRVLILPARDAGDELAATMLRQLLMLEKVEAEAVSAETLTGEILERLGAEDITAACISAVPPGAALHTRALCKRLRAGFPNLPIIVGLWDTRPEAAPTRERLAAIGSIHVASTLTQARDHLRSLAAITVKPQDSVCPPERLAG